MYDIAFSRATKKAFVISMQKKHEQTQTIQALNESASLKERKQVEASKAFQTWKRKKDMHIKTVGKMYTYHPDPRQPPKLSKWCPARSVKYDYPRDRQPNSIGSRKAPIDTEPHVCPSHHPNDDTYSPRII